MQQTWKPLSLFFSFLFSSCILAARNDKRSLLKKLRGIIDTVTIVANHFVLFQTVGSNLPNISNLRLPTVSTGFLSHMCLCVLSFSNLNGTRLVPLPTHRKYNVPWFVLQQAFLFPFPIGKVGYFPDPYSFHHRQNTSLDQISHQVGHDIRLSVPMIEHDLLIGFLQFFIFAELYEMNKFGTDKGDGDQIINGSNLGMLQFCRRRLYTVHAPVGGIP